MIVAAAFCPHPPVLVPEIAQGAAPELDDLRRAARTAIRRIGASGRPLVLLGSGPRSDSFGPTARGTFAGFGVPLEVGFGGEGTGAPELPLSLAVGAWLVQDALGPDSGAIGYCVGPDADVPVLACDAALLVLGDGSACHGTAAPGYLDDRAAAFDAGVGAALRSGDPQALCALDDRTDLLAAGPPAWRAAGRLLADDDPDSRYDAELLYQAAPYGVGYFVAVWQRRG